MKNKGKEMGMAKKININRFAGNLNIWNEELLANI